MLATCGGTSNSGGSPRRGTRTAAAVADASATGIMLRGRHSKRSSSTASRTAATGVPKVALIPAAAPATSSVLRSAAVRWKNWATMEPTAPPVMMIGPSAPNGPPEPMLTAEESGFSTATFGSTRLRPMRIASIASGMPWPRMRSLPYRAIRPMSNAPMTGTAITNGPSVLSAGDAGPMPRRPKKKRFVKTLMSRSSTSATAAPMAPSTTAMPEISSRRGPTTKSPSRAAPSRSRASVAAVMRGRARQRPATAPRSVPQPPAEAPRGGRLRGGPASGDPWPSARRGRIGGHRRCDGG